MQTDLHRTDANKSRCLRTCWRSHE